MKRRSALLLFGFIATVSSSAAAQEVAAGSTHGDQAGPEERYRPNRPLLVAGAATFLGAYGTGVVVAAESSLDADKRLYIPVVGMWLDVANRPCTTCTTGDTFATISFVAGGVAQVVGLGLVAVSFALPEKERKIHRASVQVVPLQLAGGGGLGAIGAF